MCAYCQHLERMTFPQSFIRFQDSLGANFQRK